LALARRLSFGFKPGGLAQPLPGSKAPVARLFKPPQARRADTTSAGVEGPGSKAFQTAKGPEGRYNLDLVGCQNLATLGCVSPSGLAMHRGLQPVVTTTGRGCASPPGLRKSKGLGNSQRLEEGPKALALSPEGWHTLCRGRRPR
jgi:hypothetical protein